MSGTIGWRATSCVAASASAAAAALFAAVWLASPPVPRPTPPAKPPPARSRDDTGRGVLRELRDVARVPAARLLLGAVTARFFAGYALAAWQVPLPSTPAAHAAVRPPPLHPTSPPQAPFYRTYFPEHVRLFGVVHAALVAIAGTASTVIGGALGDWLATGAERTGASRRPHRALLVPVFGSALAVPLWLAVFRCDHFALSMALTTAAYLAAECWFGPAVSALQAVVPRSAWGTAQGLMNAVQIIGNGSPLLIGALAARGAPLRSLLGAVVPITHACCVLLFVFAARETRRATADARADKRE